MQITSEQKQAVDRGEAVDVTVDRTECVLVRRDVFDRVRRLVADGDWTADELRESLVQSAEGNGWNDPAMDEYDRYDEIRAGECP